MCIMNIYVYFFYNMYIFFIPKIFLYNEYDYFVPFINALSSIVKQRANYSRLLFRKLPI